jgi:hypothetical protein
MKPRMSFSLCKVSQGRKNSASYGELYRDVGGCLGYGASAPMFPYA